MGWVLIRAAGSPFHPLPNEQSLLLFFPLLSFYEPDCSLPPSTPLPQIPLLLHGPSDPRCCSAAHIGAGLSYLNIHVAGATSPPISGPALRGFGCLHTYWVWI